MNSMNDRNLGSALNHVGKDRAVASNRQTTALASVIFSMFVWALSQACVLNFFFFLAMALKGSIFHTNVTYFCAARK